MIRFLFKLVLCVMLALAAGFVYLAVVSGDPVYTVYEWMSPARFQRYDRLIRVVAVEHWKLQSDPVPFGLAEYNAGASRAQRWSKNDVSDTSARTFLKNVDFPGTRKYVESIIDRYKFYQRRGRM